MAADVAWFNLLLRPGPPPAPPPVLIALELEELRAKKGRPPPLPPKWLETLREKKGMPVLCTLAGGPEAAAVSGWAHEELRDLHIEPVGGSQWP